MVSLYNCKHDGDQYRITKFTDGLEVESSYLVDPTACECPAFTKRGRCKHQEMLPFFVNRRAVGSGEMFDWERGGWVRMFPDEPEPEPAIAPLPAGVVMIGLEDPELLHNTLAEALDEAPLRAHGSAVTTPDFDSANGGSNPPAPAKVKTKFPDEPEPVAVAATVERDAQPSPEIEPTVTQASAVAAPRFRRR